MRWRLEAELLAAGDAAAADCCSLPGLCADAAAPGPRNAAAADSIDAAAADCWPLPGLCADTFTSPSGVGPGGLAAAGLGGGGPGGPAAAARRAAGGMRLETCGTVAELSARFANLETNRAENSARGTVSRVGTR